MRADGSSTAGEPHRPGEPTERCGAGSREGADTPAAGFGDGPVLGDPLISHLRPKKILVQAGWGRGTFSFPGT